VFNVLLQVLDDGRMTDGQGRTVDFKNTVIVMTSNLGSHKIQSMDSDDPAVVKLAVMAEVRGTSVPSSSTGSTRSWCSMRSTRRTSARSPRSSCAPGAAPGQDGDDARHRRRSRCRRSRKAGFDPVYGARPLKRAIQQQIENPLSKRSCRAASGRRTQGGMHIAVSRTVTMGGQQTVSDGTEDWRLSPDGKTLTIHRIDNTPRGRMEFDMVFLRQ
jgi:hypothetical protein